MVQKKQILLTTLCAFTLLTASAFADVNHYQNCPPNTNCVQRPHHKGPAPKFDKEQHKKQIEAFEQRLNLTAEQKAQIEKNREKSRQKMQKIMEQEKKLKEQKRAIMEENKKDFEAVLTDEQKAELNKMHEEMKAKMQAMKAKHQGEQKAIQTKTPQAKKQPIKK